jgi:tetratricopeptide (TPR) repeat protein
VREEQTRLAILGTGGIGKTSTALHILHHQEVISRYNNRRYFVGCDAVTSAESLATLILQIIQAPSVAGENILTVLHQALLATPLTLLLLDNFETAWDINTGRDGVLDLLQKIGNSKHVSLIITMRSAVPPPGIVWSRFENLPPMSPPDAKSLFLAINSSLNAGDGKEDENLDTLLAEMDYVPLAVMLLAQVSIGFSPRYMLNRWREKQTEILCTHKVTPGKLESIEVSVSLSLATLEITSNPDAVQLLGILCQLPDGLRQWEERLPLIWAGHQSVHDLVHVLHKTALLFIAGSGLKVLSPIRHFINRHHQADVVHIRRLESEFWTLVDRYAGTRFGPGFLHARNIIEPEMGNIRSLVKTAVQTHPSAHLVEIVLKISQFLMRTVPSTEMLDCIMVMVEQSGSLTQQARVLQLAGENLLLQAKYTEASEALTEARRQFLKIDNILGAAQCSRSFGEILCIQSKYTEAFETLIEARRQLLMFGDVFSAAQCSRALGATLYMQCRFTEAFETLTEAQNQFLEIGDVLGVAQCSKCLGDILCAQSKYTEAYETLVEAQRQFLRSGDIYGAVQCSQRLGGILCIQDKYTEASETLTDARRQFLEIGNVHSAARCSQSLGDVLRMQFKYTEAAETLTEARRQFLEIGYVLGAAQCSLRLGEILHVQSQYAEASETLTEARRESLEIGDILGVAQCSQTLGDILQMQSQYTKASETLTEARRQFLEIGNFLGAAQCSRSLSNILRMQSKYTEAFEALAEARRHFLAIGHVLDAAKCSESLDGIVRMQTDNTAVTDTL